MELFEVDAFGVISLYQATRHLLQESPNKPIFAPVGSGAGALGCVQKQKKAQYISREICKLIMV